MFLKDKKGNILLPETITLPRQDSNPLVIHLEGNTSSPSTYQIKSSLGNNYVLHRYGGASFYITGDVEQITHVKFYNFGDWVGATAQIRDIKINDTPKQTNAYGRPFYKTIKNSYTIGAEEITSSGNNGYVEAIWCNDQESTCRAFLDYMFFPNQYLIRDSNNRWGTCLGSINYRSTYTSIPFAIEARYNNGNKNIYGLYLGNGGNNTGQPQYWNAIIEIYEKNEGSTNVTTPPQRTITYRYPGYCSAAPGATVKTEYNFLDTNFRLHNAVSEKTATFIGWSKGNTSSPALNPTIVDTSEDANLEYYARFNKYWVDVNWDDMTTGTRYWSGAPYKFDVYVNGSRVLEQGRDWGGEVPDGALVEIKNLTQYDTNYTLYTPQISLSQVVHWTWSPAIRFKQA